MSEILLPKVARTATVEVGFSAVRAGRHHESIWLRIDTDAIVSTPSVVPTIKAVVPGQEDVDLLVGVAITAAGQVLLKLTPHETAVANQIAQIAAPELMRLEMAHADGDSITYGVVLIHA
jgi:hypothetical protein